MPEQLAPETLASVLADIDRRLHSLETSARNGLSLTRSAWGTAAGDITVFGAPLDPGPASSTWRDDLGNTGTGYPQIVMTTPTRCLVAWSVRPNSVAFNGTTYRSNSLDIDVAVDGVRTSLPNTRRFIANSNLGPVDAAVSAFAVMTFARGSHTFKMVCNATDNVPAGTTAPRLTDISMFIIPLNA
jgi:hypothetical protein